MSSSEKKDVAGSDSEEEEDYMSDAFLQKLEKGDVRPGLKHVRNIWKVEMLIHSVTFIRDTL